MHTVMDNLKLGEIKGCDRSKEKGDPVKGAHNKSNGKSFFFFPMFEGLLKSGSGVDNGQRHYKYSYSLASVTHFGVIFSLQQLPSNRQLTQKTKEIAG